MRQTALFALTIVFLAGLITAGCARRLVGSPIQEENIPKIAVGKTTRDEILKLFGSPYRIEAKGDEEIITYLYGTESVYYYGVYVEQQQKADILIVFINQKGIVSNYTFSKGVSSPDFLLKRPGPPY